jgi:glycosyltransferase involved in cell wall biosynthesis
MSKRFRGSACHNVQSTDNSGISMESRNNPLVSICLPVFNGEHFLAPALESVLSQTFSDFELIIVDDCSTDQSTQIIERYASRDKRIKHWRNSEQVGLFRNYNRCFELASGQYIKPFAQDDILHNDMVRKLVDVLNADSYIVLTSTARTPICQKGTRIVSMTPQASADTYVPPLSSISGREVIKKAINPVVNFIGEPTTVMFRNAHVGSGFDSDFHHLGDLEYWFRILQNGRYLYINEELCSYRMHGGSTSTTNQKYLLYASDLLRLGRKYKRFIWEAGSTQAEFNDHVIRRAALDLNARGVSFQNQLLNMEPEFFNDFDQFASKSSTQTLPVGLLELTLQALLRVTPPEPQAQPAQDRSFIVYTLEHTLQTYLASPSWRSTKFLRDIKKKLFNFEDQYDLDGSPAEFAYAVGYERYLRRQIWRLRHSRSWKITQPVRTASKSLEMMTRLYGTHVKPRLSSKPLTPSSLR